MNRLNLKIYMLNWKLAEHLYTMRCVKEDEEDKRKRGYEVGGREREVDGY